MNVMIVVFNCQKCDQCLKGKKYLGSPDMHKSVKISTSSLFGSTNQHKKHIHLTLFKFATNQRNQIKSSKVLIVYLQLYWPLKLCLFCACTVLIVQTTPCAQTKRNEPGVRIQRPKCMMAAMLFKNIYRWSKWDANRNLGLQDKCKNASESLNSQGIFFFGEIFTPLQVSGNILNISRSIYFVKNKASVLILAF